MKNNDAIFSLFGTEVWHPVPCFTTKLNQPHPFSIIPPPLNLIERNKPLGGFLKDLQ